MDWFGFGEGHQLKTIRKYRNFKMHDISNAEAMLYPKNTAVIEECVSSLKHYMKPLLIFLH